MDAGGVDVSQRFPVLGAHQTRRCVETETAQQLLHRTGVVHAGGASPHVCCGVRCAVEAHPCTHVQHFQHSGCPDAV